MKNCHHNVINEYMHQFQNYKFLLKYHWSVRDESFCDSFADYYYDRISSELLDYSTSLPQLYWFSLVRL